MEQRIINFEGNIIDDLSIIARFFDVPEDMIIKLSSPFSTDHNIYQYLLNDSLIYISGGMSFSNYEYNCIVYDKLYVSGRNYQIMEFNIGSHSEKLREIHEMQKAVFSKITEIFKLKPLEFS